jgi:transmembrane sensor
MMTDTGEQMRLQAIDWAIATHDPDFSDWDGFARWLEADPRHTIAYDQALSAGAKVAELSAEVRPALSQAANDEDPVVYRAHVRRRWMVGALAASLLAVVAIPAWQMRPQPYSVTTAMGQSESVDLPDGSRIVMNGGTTLALDRRYPRYARLETGEALFEVRHNAADPFVVESGDVRLVDAGTAFNVLRDGGSLDVAVSEGVVIVNPKAENVRLPAGRRASIAGTSASILVSDVPVDQVASWRSGRLSFSGTSLAQVAAALERSLGARISVVPSIAARPFSGVVQIAGRDSAAVTSIAPVLGTRAVRRGDGWELVGDDARP